MTEPTVRFRDWECTVLKRHYTNGRVRLDLIDVEDGSPDATATVNLPDVSMEPNRVCVKNWSENEGILQALTEAGVVTPTGRAVRSGFVEVPVCELMPPYREHAAAVRQSKGRGRAVGQ